MGPFSAWVLFGLFWVIFFAVIWVIKRRKAWVLTKQAELSARELQVDEVIKDLAEAVYRQVDRETLVPSISRFLVSDLGARLADAAIAHIQSGRIKFYFDDADYHLLDSHRRERCVVVCGGIYFEKSAELIIALPLTPGNNVSSAVLWYLARHPT